VISDSEAAASMADTSGHRFVIESGVSRLSVRATAAGLLSAFGHSPTFVFSNLSGEVVYNAAAPASSTMRMTIPASSPQLQEDMSEKDKREIMRATLDEVLEATKYPEIVYECQEVRPRGGKNGPVELELNGRLTLHGETRPQTVIAKIVVMGDLLRANGEFSVRQTDFGIRPVSVGGRMLQLKDELNCTFDIASRRRG
jgi:polyisoprenoid-binding protein YceI